ncbi:hypothetical protein, partial [Actinoalloteichus caeruleus]|uniref:hypothetical protein n=1 Tax=Actinoalloteichus cyanogriseus TaxID=2893586 RepID=UPI001B80D652
NGALPRPPSSTSRRCVLLDEPARLAPFRRSAVYGDNTARTPHGDPGDRPQTRMRRTTQPE